MARLIKLLSGQRKKQGNWNLAPIWTKIKIVTQAPGLRANPHILPCFVVFHLLQEILKKKESLPIWHRRTASFFLQTFPVDIMPTPLSAVLTYYLYFHSRLFGATGQCAHCSKTILPLEMVMRAREHTYHLDCFACHICQYRFCVGDKFFLHFQVVLCEADYYDITSIFNVNDMAYYVWLPVISPLILIHHFRKVWKRTGREQLTIKN